MASATCIRQWLPALCLGLISLVVVCVTGVVSRVAKMDVPEATAGASCQYPRSADL